MNSMINNFLTEVLGPDAAMALGRATAKSQALDSVLGPRVVLGWLNLAKSWVFEGTIPGVPDSTLSFSKSEGDLLSGSISMGGELFDFTSADVTQLAATVMVALGAQQPICKGLRDSDLVNLGKSIDLLLKSRVLQLQKAQQELGGTQAQPNLPNAPLAPEAQKKATAAQQPKLPSQTKIKLTKSQAANRCSVCGAASFNKRGELTCCYCMRSLAKSAQAIATEDGFEVTFGKDWNPSNIRVFLDIIGG